jgi:hypothetical protein
MRFKAMILPFLLLLLFNNLATAFAMEESLQEIDLPEVKLNHTQKTHDAFFDVFCPCSEFEPQLVEKSKKISYQRLMQKENSLLKLSSIGLRYIYLDSIFRTPLGEKIDKANEI